MASSIAKPQAEIQTCNESIQKQTDYMEGIQYIDSPTLIRRVHQMLDELYPDFMNHPAHKVLQAVVLQQYQIALSEYQDQCVAECESNIDSLKDKLYNLSDELDSFYE